MSSVHWIAYYSNGQIFHEGEIPSEELDRSLLNRFILIDKNGKIYIDLKPQRDQILFFRRRTFRLSYPDQYSIHLVGTRNPLHFFIVKSDGAVIEDNQFRNEWYEPQWLPQEQV